MTGQCARATNIKGTKIIVLFYKFSDKLALSRFQGNKSFCLSIVRLCTISTEIVIEDDG